MPEGYFFKLYDIVGYVKNEVMSNIAIFNKPEKNIFQIARRIFVIRGNIDFVST